MLTTKTMQAYTVFPDWVFEGEIYLTKEIVSDIFSDINSLPKQKQNYGWNTDKNQLTPTLQNLRKLVGNLFYENVTPHFKIQPNKNRVIESVDAQIYCVAPGHTVNTIVNKLRWYQAVVFISDNTNGSDIALNLFSEKFHSAPPGIENTQPHILKAAPFKTYFWPAHIPWNFTVNKSSSPTIALVNSFVVKKAGT